jgi:hypothetical protein
MNRQTIERLFGDYMDMKRQAVANGEDLPMILFCADVPLDEDLTSLAMVLPNGDAYIVAEALAHLCAKLFIPHWIATCSDAYIALDADFDEHENLEDAFMAGDKRVTEALTMTAVEKGGDIYIASCSYVHDREDGYLSFGEMDYPDDPRQSYGPILEMTKAIVELAHLPEADIMKIIASRLN